MTKADIRAELMIIKESLKGQSANHYRQSDNPSDYDWGYGQACETYAKRLEALLDKMKE